MRMAFSEVLPHDKHIGASVPNMRMQSDAAARPQDHSHFGAQLRLKAISIYRCGAADAQMVSPLITSHRFGNMLFYMLYS